MVEIFNGLVESEFMPHGHCYLWRPDVLWLNVVSDIIIFLAYSILPIVLVFHSKRVTGKKLKWGLIMFAYFIAFCGLTHLVNVWNVWHGNYIFAGIVKAITAALSFATAVLFFPIASLVIRELDAFENRKE